MNGLGQLTLETLASDQRAVVVAANTYGGNSPQAKAAAQKLMSDQQLFMTGNIPGTPGALINAAQQQQQPPSVLPYVIGGAIAAGVVGGIVWWLTR